MYNAFWMAKMEISGRMSNQDPPKSSTRGCSKDPDLAFDWPPTEEDRARFVLSAVQDESSRAGDRARSDAASGTPARSLETSAAGLTPSIAREPPTVFASSEQALPVEWAAILEDNPGPRESSSRSSEQRAFAWPPTDDTLAQFGIEAEPCEITRGEINAPAATPERSLEPRMAIGVPEIPARVAGETGVRVASTAARVGAQGASRTPVGWKLMAGGGWVIGQAKDSGSSVSRLVKEGGVWALRNLVGHPSRVFRNRLAIVVVAMATIGVIVGLWLRVAVPPPRAVTFQAARPADPAHGSRPTGEMSRSVVAEPVPGAAAGQTSNQQKSFAKPTRVETGTIWRPTAAPVFSSHYTNIRKECKTAEAGKDDAEGGDIPWTCPAYRDYQATISWSATHRCLFIQRIAPPNDKYETMLPAIACDRGTAMTERMLEWRLADGRLFAVIVRRSDWDERESDHPKKIGERLVVKGLTGFESINTSVDTTKESRANDVARERADDGYRQILR